MKIAVKNVFIKNVICFHKVFLLSKNPSSGSAYCSASPHESNMYCEREGKVSFERPFINVNVLVECTLVVEHFTRFNLKMWTWKNRLEKTFLDSYLPVKSIRYIVF